MNLLQFLKFWLSFIGIFFDRHFSIVTFALCVTVIFITVKLVPNEEIIEHKVLKDYRYENGEYYMYDSDDKLKISKYDEETYCEVKSDGMYVVKYRCPKIYIFFNILLYASIFCFILFLILLDYNTYYLLDDTIRSCVKEVDDKLILFSREVTSKDETDLKNFMVLFLFNKEKFNELYPKVSKNKK